MSRLRSLQKSKAFIPILSFVWIAATLAVSLIAFNTFLWSMITGGPVIIAVAEIYLPAFLVASLLVFIISLFVFAGILTRRVDMRRQFQPVSSSGMVLAASFLVSMLFIHALLIALAYQVVVFTDNPIMLILEIIICLIVIIGVPAILFVYKKKSTGRRLRR